MRREKDPYAKRLRLGELTDLLARAGLYAEAVKLVETAGEPPRAGGGYLEIALVAIQSGQAEFTQRMFDKLRTQQDWPMAEVAKACMAAGDVTRAYQLAVEMEYPATEKTELLLGLARQFPPNRPRTELRRRLSEALDAAVQVNPGELPDLHSARGVHRTLLDFDPRHAAVLDVIGAGAELGELDFAQDALQAFARTEWYKNPTWKAKALLEIAKARKASDQNETALQLVDQALSELETLWQRTVGDNRDYVDVKANAARLLGELGQQERARALLSKTMDFAEHIDSIPPPEIRVHIGLEMFRAIASGYLALGARSKALGTLGQAARLVDGYALPPTPTKQRTEEVPGRPFDDDGTPQDSEWNSLCMAQQDKIEARAQLAAAFEEASADASAKRALATAIGEIRAIRCSSRREHLDERGAGIPRCQASRPSARNPDARSEARSRTKRGMGGRHRTTAGRAAIRAHHPYPAGPACTPGKGAVSRKDGE